MAFYPSISSSIHTWVIVSGCASGRLPATPWWLQRHGQEGRAGLADHAAWWVLQWRDRGILFLPDVAFLFSPEWHVA